MESSIVVPFTFWNNSEPTFSVSLFRITPNGRKLVTSSYDGELCIWNLNVEELEISPRNVLMGHSYPVTCLECTDDYAISTSEGGEICRWHLQDGYCSKSVKSVFVHRRVQLFKSSRLEDELLFACGDYHEIFIIHSVLLQTVLALLTKENSDWISCFQAFHSLEIGRDVVFGVTKSNHIKFWTVGELCDEIAYELQSSSLPVTEVSDVKCSSNQTQILVISEKYWTMFDAKFLKIICSAKRICNEKFISGDFHNGDILIWTTECRIYLFKMQIDGPSLTRIFSDRSVAPNLFPPAMCFHRSNKGNYMVQCDKSGAMAFWKITDNANIGNGVNPFFSCELNSKFKVIKSRIFENYMKEVTCCKIISGFDLFAVGCKDGTIVIVPATQTISSYYFHSEVPNYRTLLAHRGRINCLLYPHEKYSYHHETHLLSGGSDFSVCLWDISTCTLVHRFCVQSGEIIKLLVPPAECKARVKNSVCSVASDHSVAILNLKELKCIVLASRQIYPVVTINWRPLDDFIIIECFDGTVFIWEMETGHLDRVLYGITAQEVIYACKESNQEDVSNFYLRDDGILGNGHFDRGLYHIEKDIASGGKSHLMMVRGFLDGVHSENQILAFNVNSVLGQVDANYLNSEKINPDTYQHVQLLTQQTTSALPARKPFDREIEKERETNAASTKKVATFLLSLLQKWNNVDARSGILASDLLLQPEEPVQYSLISPSRNVSIFLSTAYAVSSPVLHTNNTIALAALTAAITESPLRHRHDYKSVDSEAQTTASDAGRNGDCDLSIETLAGLWQSGCLTVRYIARRLLLSKLRSQTVPERSLLLHRWLKYLPHFDKVDGIKTNEFDQEIVQMRTVALVLFGLIGSDFKFKISDSVAEETYLQETCSSIERLLHENAKPQFAEMQVIATNMLGRGYAVWEQHLKFEKLFHILFETASEYEKCRQTAEMTPALDKCLNAHEALKSIAIARTDAFVGCLTKEIAQIRNSPAPKTQSAFMERYKTEIILILTDLLERTPYMMLQHLNDIVSVFVYCVNFGHLKHDRIDSLIPVLGKFKQIDHSMATQRIAVGLHDGSVAIHELKTLKMHRIAAHSDCLNAVTFSPDGKVLATYCYFENRLCFWQVLASIFGLGHTHIKCIKTYGTSQIHDEDIRNHLEICELTWVDNKSVLLRLCDGSQSVYHS